MDKDLACDIHVVNLRTMLKAQYKMEPGDNAALILHREGFNSCYKPVGLTCSTNEGKVKILRLFSHLERENLSFLIGPENCHRFFSNQIFNPF